jgi:pSer/pThr/pTyr-binding forkhead associated (FHA) protein
MMNLKPGESTDEQDTRPYLSLSGLGDLAEGQHLKVRLGETISLGRSRHCDWSLRRTPRFLKSHAESRVEIKGDLAYSSVSRRHATLSYLAEDLVEVQNLSGNGTLVDGVLVDKLVLTDCRTATHRIQLGPKGVILELQPGSLPL